MSTRARVGCPVCPMRMSPDILDSHMHMLHAEPHACTCGCPRKVSGAGHTRGFASKSCLEDNESAKAMAYRALIEFSSTMERIEARYMALHALLLE